MARTSPLSRGRRIAIWSLIVVASLLAIVAILATWVNRQMLDNGSFQTTSTRLVQDPAIQSALSTISSPRPTTTSTSPPRSPSGCLQVSSRWRRRWPRLRQPATNAVDRLSIGRGCSALRQRDHRDAPAARRGRREQDGRGHVDRERERDVDLGALVQQIGPSLGLPAAALDRMPPQHRRDHGHALRPARAAQTGVKAVRVVSTWLVVLVLALFAAAIYLAAGARRETLRKVGWAFVFVGLLVLVVRGSRRQLHRRRPRGAGYRDAVNHAWLICELDPRRDRARDRPLRAGRRAGRGARRAEPPRGRDAQPARADPQRAARHHVGRVGVRASCCSCSGAAPTLSRPGGGSCCSAACSHSASSRFAGRRLREFPEPRPKPAGDATSVGARAAAALRPKPERPAQPRPPSSLAWLRCTTAAR